MRLTGLLLFAASSLLLAKAATRPQYGGTLRVAMRETLVNLDPAGQASPSTASTNVSHLIFETLTSLDEAGRVQPWLATSWQAEPGSQRWHFELRPGVTFQEGSALTPDAVSGSLRAANPDWKVFTSGQGVVIECNSSCPDLPAELTLARNGIARRDGKLSGTGPFAITQWEPGKKLTLSAREGYWRGRPFLDAIEIEMGENLREQMIALDLGKTDLIEVAPEAWRSIQGRRVESSAPTELLALAFTRERQSADDGQLREALALSIDRGLLSNAVLQGGGEVAGGLLPGWLSGYGFLFPAGANLAQARQITATLRQPRAWTLAYDTADPLERIVAERIALNAHDAGLAIQMGNTAAADIRLVRLPLASMDAGLALSQSASSLSLAGPRISGPGSENLYAAESSLLQTQRAIPLLHLRQVYGIGQSVMNWHEGVDGSWRLQDAWLEMEKP